MKKSIKVLCAIFCVIIAVACLGMFAALAGIISYGAAKQLCDWLYTSDVMRICAVSVTGLFFVVCITVFILILTDKERKTVTLSTVEGGTISLAVDALKEMARRTARNVENVKEVQVEAHVDKNGAVSLTINTSIRTRRVLSETVEDIRRSVKEYIETTTAVNIDTVSVVVTETLD